MEREKHSLHPDALDMEIQCPVDTRVLAVVRTFIVTLAAQMGFDDEEIDKIEMAVDEACANVVRHAYKHLGVSPDLPDEQRTSSSDAIRQCVLKMGIGFSHDLLEICIIDHGIGVDKTPPGVNSLDEYQEKGGTGGLGVYIIRNFMDEVEYHAPPDSGTILVMRKYLKSAAGQAS